MKALATRYKEELFSEIEGMPTAKVKEVLDFVCFLKAKEAIDPTQTYFWTMKWQEMEREADEDKKSRNVIGKGSVENLLKELKS